MQNLDLLFSVCFANIHFWYSTFFQIGEMQCKLPPSKLLTPFSLTCQVGLVVEFGPHKLDVWGLNPSRGMGDF